MVQKRRGVELRRIAATKNSLSTRQRMDTFFESVAKGEDWAPPFICCTNHRRRKV